VEELIEERERLRQCAEMADMMQSAGFPEMVEECVEKYAFMVGTGTAPGRDPPGAPPPSCLLFPGAHFAVCKQMCRNLNPTTRTLPARRFTCC